MPTLGELPIYQLRSKYSQIKFTRYTFAHNYRELMCCLDKQQSEWFNTLFDDTASVEHLLEVSRLVHNYVIAAMTLRITRGG